MQAKFYLISLLQHILLFLAGVFLYLSHRCLGLSKLGLVSSVLLVVFLESTLMPQAAWSENVAVLLMAMILFISLYLPVNPGLTGQRSVCLTVVLSLFLGVFVTTRAVPILILPALILLLRRILPRDRVIRFSLVATAGVTFVVGASMAMNFYRYGRFELSDSAGRQLWHAITPATDD